MENPTQLDGFRFLDPVKDVAQMAQLGPLKNLVGTWQNGMATGWNIISVPDNSMAGYGPPGPFPNGYVLEVIPYTEVITFRPAIQVVNSLNLGPAEQKQQFGALFYETSIHSAFTNDFLTARGFYAGKLLHHETGVLLYLPQGADNNGNPPNYARMAIVPHGNSLLAQGTASTITKPGPLSIPPVSTLPWPPQPGNFNQPYFTAQFPPEVLDAESQINPNKFLTIINQGVTYQEVTHISLTSAGFGSGVLNIPFITHNINTTAFSVDYWIQTLANGSVQLQYSQTSNLKFRNGITFPHVDVNSLVRKS